MSFQNQVKKTRMGRCRLRALTKPLTVCPSQLDSYLHAFLACPPCMLSLHAFPACPPCMSSLHAFPTCLPCMSSLHAFPACTPRMPSLHALPACLPCDSTRFDPIPYLFALVFRFHFSIPCLHFVFRFRVFDFVPCTVQPLLEKYWLKYS